MRGWLIGLVGVCCVAPVWGQGLKPVSAEEFRAEVGRAEGLVAACRKDVKACDAGAVGADVRVQPDGFAVRWDWLRETLAEAKDAKVSGREEMLEDAAARLREDEGARGEAAPDVSAARKKVDGVLAGVEFRAVKRDNYLTEKLAALGLILNAALDRLGAYVPHSPWFGVLLEWGVLGLAAAGLLLWAWRVSQQQRLMVVAESSGGGQVWQKESDDWAARAAAEAGRGEWREAVHSLYWSAIVMLEGQKLWRQNRARTPREYVRLLEPGSAKRGVLAGLTGVFERIWYGLRPAGEQDYARAKELLDELRVG